MSEKAIPQLEIGTTEAIQRRVTRRLTKPQQAGRRRLILERSRPQWLREMIGEALGVFFYTYPAIGQTASLLLSGKPSTPAHTFMLGVGVALGIAFAIIIAGPTSGGHFNPGLTIVFALFHGFPIKKVPRYIFAQILGSMLAASLCMGQYRQDIIKFEGATLAAGRPMAGPGSPAAIFVPFPPTPDPSLGYLLMNEFFICAYIALVIFASLDTANPFVAPSSAPFTIGLSYAMMIWAFSPLTISTNTARDLGARCLAAAFYGKEVFSFGNVAWIYILVNIAASVFAALLYELVFKDSVPKPSNETPDEA